MFALLALVLHLQGQEPIRNGKSVTGYEVQLDKARLGIEFITPDIVRVQYALGEVLQSNGTAVRVERNLPAPKVRTHKTAQSLTLRSDSLILEVDLQTGAIAYKDKRTGRLLLSEQAVQPHVGERIPQEKIMYDESSARTVKTANGDITQRNIIRRDTVGYVQRYRLNLSFQKGEALYGLGAHMEDYMNLRGKTMYLCQHNLKAMVPVLNSTAGYGLLFDAGCGMIFHDSIGSEGHSQGYLQLEAANELDYYFMKGERLDDVVANYRLLTGDCPMLPRYMLGYIQSKERYVSQDDLLNTLREYRRRHLPIDVIVQDWNYWPQGWGYMKMNPKYYPNPKEMADEVHRMNAKLMVSIWPNPQYCPQAEDFKRKGYMLPHDVYDAFNPEARKYYWTYANNEFFSKGFDAWWCDCSEPVDGDWKPMGQHYGWDNHAERWRHNLNILSEACGAQRSSLYSLYHSMGIYENQRLTSQQKRVVNLTRSAYAGQQRFSTINWNGDTHASWQSFRQQIPAGLNYMATGCPYWTVDVGAFFTRNDGRWFYKGEFPKGVRDPQYREFYTRMLQYATFLPILRSHGTDTPREVWQFGEPGTPYYDAIVQSIHLRYQLLPYLYSLVAKTTREQYTPTRLLAFDFAQDAQVHDIKDQFMLGASLLVCPVTQPQATTRSVYLPAGTDWYDYWTGERLAGGQTREASAPLERIPLYVRAGSILPTTEVAEYTEAQIGRPITLTIYPGATTTFTLYEDEGDNYNYEQGAYALIPLQWDDARATLTIGARKGSYAGMPRARTFIIKTPTGTQSLTYTGKKTQITLTSN